MGLSEFVLVLAGIAAGIVFGWGIAVICSQPHMAYALFWFSAIFFAVLGSIWAFQARAYGMKTRVAVSVATIAVSAIGLFFVLARNEACAQGTGQTNYGAPNINVPGNGNNIYAPIMPPSSGATVIENSGGGIGADISVQGSPGSTVPNVGLNTNGLKIIQSGPGVGMRVTVGGNGGSAIGVLSTVIGR